MIRAYYMRLVQGHFDITVELLKLWGWRCENTLRYQFLEVKRECIGLFMTILREIFPRKTSDE